MAVRRRRRRRSKKREPRLQVGFGLEPDEHAALLEIAASISVIVGARCSLAEAAHAAFSRGLPLLREHVTTVEDAWTRPAKRVLHLPSNTRSAAASAASTGSSSRVTQSPKSTA